MFLGPGLAGIEEGVIGMGENIVESVPTLMGRWARYRVVLGFWENGFEIDLVQEVIEASILVVIWCVPVSDE